VTGTSGADDAAPPGREVEGFVGISTWEVTSD